MIQGVLDIHPGNFCLGDICPGYICFGDICLDDICPGEIFPCIIEPQRGFILMRPPAHPPTLIPAHHPQPVLIN